MYLHQLPSNIPKMSSSTIGLKIQGNRCISIEHRGWLTILVLKGSASRSFFYLLYFEILWCYNDVIYRQYESRR